jgi:hypothetical protein
MTALDTASLVFYPSGYKESKLYSIKPTDGTGDLTFTRASSATRVNAQGLIETVASNVPRIDYTGGGCGSLLLEPQRTNLLTYSEAFDNWSLKTGITVLSNQLISPNGTLNASEIKTSAAGSRYVGENYSLSTGDNVFSVFAKKGANNWIYLNVVQDVSNNWNFTFDLENGVIGQSNSSAYLASASIENYGDGWYRIIVKANVTSAGVFAARIYPADSATDVNTNVGDSVYIYGAQLEAGSYATSIINTAGTTVTRIQDASSTAGLSSVINSTEGVLYAELQNDELGRVTISDGTYNNVVMVQLGGVAAAIVFKIGGSSNSISGTGVLGFNKLAIKWDATNIKMFLNGVLIGTSPTGSTFAASTLNSLQFNRGDGSSSGQFFGNCQNLIIFPTALTDEQLETLTTL